MTLEQGKMIGEALGHYAVKPTSISLIRHNENLTARIDTAEGSYALRIRKPVEGFRCLF